MFVNSFVDFFGKMVYNGRGVWPMEEHEISWEIRRQRAIGARIKAERKRCKWSAGYCRQQLDGKSDTAWYNIEKGEVRLHEALLKGIAHIFGKSVAFFTEGIDDLPSRSFETLLKELQGHHSLSETIDIPFRGHAPLGHPSLEEENVEGHIPIPKSQLPTAGKHIYAIKAVGDSLTGSGINSGDAIIVDPDADMVDGKIYVVRMENEVVTRHIYVEGKSVRLVATNDKYETIVPTAEVQVLGRVILSGNWIKH